MIFLLNPNLEWMSNRWPRWMKPVASQWLPGGHHGGWKRHERDWDQWVERRGDVDESEELMGFSIDHMGYLIVIMGFLIFQSNKANY